MVQVSSFYEDRSENISTQRWREGWKPLSSVPQSRKMVPNKETDAVILENLKDQESTAPQSKSAPLSQDHENKGDFFTQQLKEIDKDLGIYEDPLNVAATNSISNKEVSPLFDLENLKNSLEVNPGLPPQHFLVIKITRKAILTYTTSLIPLLTTWSLKLHPKSSGKDSNVSQKSSQAPGLITLVQNTQSI